MEDIKRKLSEVLKRCNAAIQLVLFINSNSFKIIVKNVVNAL